ncbi:ATP-dependent helicase HrpB [Psychromonas sp. L1A2]|uniref:ATP-dependent helicase HrpB n=1 Tax=Psychromonas sp. L1A2 TaxID=2686356 RepID=UPI00135C8AB5|nr:ATP-dependent helicase HrpB [Psychromonas sp. L1A2]
MLPIQAVLPELKQQLSLCSQVILQAPPGAGKSTYLPLMLLKEKWFTGKIIMLEPRRLAARNIAHYLAKQLGQPVGQQIGYRLRGEAKVSTETQLEIVTEGILIRLLQNDPELTGIDLVIFDEFHERNIQADLGLALCLDTQASLRENLSLLIMSATLDNQSLQQHLPNAAYVSCEGRSFPIETIYQPVLGRGLHTDKQKALVALIEMAYQQQKGNILVFVAGVRDILQCCRDLQQWINTHDLPVLLAPLYGKLSLDEQQLAIQPPLPNIRKIVVSTNIAETSLTIDGITVVVDSGVENTFQFQAQTGFGKLKSQTISEASAIQRAGRAGRLSAGTCYRLWAKDKRLAAQSEVPILQSELTSLMLEICAWGVTDPIQLPFLTQPHEKNVQVAKQLLQSIDAIDERGRCTAHGEKIIEFAVTPRLGHMVIKAQALAKILEEPNLVAFACLLTAFLEGNEKSSDDIVAELSSVSYPVKTQYQILLRKCKVNAPTTLPLQYCGLLLATAFPDRIAFSRDHSQEHDYLLSNGAGACLANHSMLLNEKMLVVADLGLSEQRSNSLIFKACAIDLEDIRKYLPHYIQSTDYLCWSLKENKLIAEQRRMLGKITLNRSPLTTVSKQQKLKALLNGLRQAGLSMLYWSDANKALLTRLRFASLQYIEAGTANSVDYSEVILLHELETWLAPFCIGITQPDQFKKIDLKAALLSRLNWQQQQKFEVDFPLTILVPTGSAIKLEYREQQNPLLSVKMQELFGQAQTPSIFDGRISIQLALLSPAMKPLQVTQNLSSFWSGAYKEVQKEMKGRYPKHFWPDDPANAIATRKTKKHLSI